jgi:hypothetical protein
MVKPVESFRVLLHRYSYQMDAMRAMPGIIRRLTERMKCRFLEGLPTATFNLFIVFRGLAPLHRRKEFPSYSWTGWRGTFEVIDLGGNDFLSYDIGIVQVEFQGSH